MTVPKNDPRPLGMPRHVVWAGFELPSACCGPPKVPNKIEKGFWGQKVDSKIG